MAHGDVEGIAVLHRSTAAAIVLAAGRGLFTAAEAELLINRLRTHAATSRLSIEDSSRLPSTAPLGIHPGYLGRPPPRPGDEQS